MNFPSCDKGKTTENYRRGFRLFDFNYLAYFELLTTFTDI